MKSKQYLEFLSESGMVGSKEIKEIINYRRGGKKEILEDMLLSLDIFTEKQLASKQSDYLDLSVIFELKPFIDWELIERFDLDYLRSNVIFPLVVSDEVLYLATRSPLDTRKLEEFESVFNMKLEPVISTRSEIEGIIKLAKNRG